MKPRLNSSPGVAEQIRRAEFLLFDFDGPIVDMFAEYPAPDIADRLLDYVEEQSAKRMHQSIRRRRDPHHIFRSLPVHLAGHHPDEASRITAAVERLLTVEEQKAVATSTATEGVLDLVTALLRSGRRRMAITSNNSAEAIEELLRGGRFPELAEAFVGQVYGRLSDPAQMKPNPDCIKRALEGLGCDDREKALMIGDSISDQEAAREWQVPFLGFAPRWRKHRKLEQAKYGAVLRTYRGLPELLH